MTGKVDILAGAFLRKLQKKAKNEVKGTEKRCFLKITQNVQKLGFYGWLVTSIICNLLKNAPEYIDPSSHFVFDEIFYSSKGSKVEKLQIKRHKFFIESYFVIYIQVSLERNSTATTRITSNTTSRWSCTRNVETKILCRIIFFLVSIIQTI